MQDLKSSFKTLFVYFLILNLNIKENKFKQTIITPLTASVSIKCQLPKADNDILIAKDEIDDLEIALGTEVFKDTPVSFSCKSGYHLKGFNNTICGPGGHWLQALPKCISLCTDEYPRSGFSTKAYFELEGVDVNHAKSFEPNTIAKISCANNFYKPEYFEDELQCTENGWLESKIPCLMQCGVPIAPITPFSKGGFDTNITEVPWHVGIYRASGTSEYENICGGTLISPRVVVTAAHCFFENKRTKETNNFEKYAVAAGKYYREYNNSKESSITAIKIRKIIEIWTPEDYAGRDGNYFGDIAIVRLSEFMPFSDTIRPICLFPANKVYKTNLNNVTGKLFTWSQLTSHEQHSVLKVLHMSAVSLEKCNDTLMQQFQLPLPEDKFCLAAFEKSTFACKGDSGSGFFVKYSETNEFILQGLISFSPIATRECSHHNLLVMTNTFYYRDILEQFMKEDLENDVDGFTMEIYEKSKTREKFCRLPSDTTYMTIENIITKESIKQGDKVPANSVYNVHCNSVYVQRGKTLAVCDSKGRWSEKFPECILKSCNNGSDFCQYFDDCLAYRRILYPEYRNLTWCEKSIDAVCCMQRSPTVIVARESRPLEKACKKWQEFVYPTCTQNVTLLSHTNVAAKKFPHMALVGVYEKSKYLWFCTGSLISPKFVIAPAHCVVLPDRIEPNRVRLGDVDYSLTDDAKTQEFTIKNHTQHPGYKPFVNYHNIVLLELNGLADLTVNVVPICLPSNVDSEYARPYGAGWGPIRYADKKPTRLQTLKLDRVDHEYCRNIMGVDSKYYPNGLDVHTQFCAGHYMNGSAAWQVDPGGPLFIEHPYRACMYEIQGMVSFYLPTLSTNNAPAVFTRIVAYVDWIESVVWKGDELP